MAMDLVEKDGCVMFSIRVVPRSSRTEIIGEHDGLLKVKISAPPVDGAANEELITLFAKRLDVPRSAISIVRGETSKTKQLRIAGVTAERFRTAIS